MTSRYDTAVSSIMSDPNQKIIVGVDHYSLMCGKILKSSHDSLTGKLTNMKLLSEGSNIDQDLSAIIG